MGDDPVVVEFLHWALGYTLAGDSRHECLFFCHGGGGRGKGTLLGIVHSTLGDYAHQAPLDLLMTSRYEQHPTSLAALAGKRMIAVSEIESGRTWDATKVKALTGNDPITARFMRADEFTFTPTFKLWLGAEHKPRIRRVDSGWRRRMLVIPFDFDPVRQDDRLKAKLRAERSRILAWMIDGAAAWQAAGCALNPPGRVTVAADNYLASQDLIAEWMEARCELDPNQFTARTALYESWCEFARDAGAEHGTPTEFYDVLRERPQLREAIIHGQRGFKGIRIR